MSVWLTIPSARPPAEALPILALWRKQGYKIALWRDTYEQCIDEKCDTTLNGWPDPYPGYATTVNAIVKRVMKLDRHAEWFVWGGDDTEPDMNHTADEIAAQCSEHFRIENESRQADRCVSGMLPDMLRSTCPTFGVMQPTGDRFDGGQIDRICGSPWVGREFCRRINQGNGPLWPEYKHMWLDEELQHVAIKYGVLWQRPELIHLHHHFARASAHLNSGAVAVNEGGVTLYGGAMKPRPAFLDEANSGAHWSKYRGIFLERKRLGFPGSEPL